MDELTDHDWLQIEQAAAGCISGSSDEWPDLMQAIAKVRRKPMPFRKSAAWLQGFCESLMEWRAAALLPCPFCGGKSIAEPGSSFPFMLCKTCGCAGPVSYLGTIEATKKDSIRLWNQRATASEAYESAFHKLLAWIQDGLEYWQTAETCQEYAEAKMTVWESVASKARRLLAEASATQHEGTKPSS